MPLLTNGASRLLGGGRVAWYRAGGAPLPVAAYQPKGAASLAASYINLANNGAQYNAAPGVAPTWSAGAGWTFNGANQYLTTGVTTLRTWSYIVRFSGVANTGVLFGGGSAGREADIKPSDSDGKRYHSQGGYLGIAPAVVAGVLATAGNKSYRDGVADAGTIPAGGGDPSYALFVGAGQWNGVANFFVIGSIQAVAIYSATLSAAQVAAVSAAMAAL